jgi:hypothetical protein
VRDAARHHLEAERHEAEGEDVEDDEGSGAGADREAVAKGKAGIVHVGGQVRFSLWRSMALRYSTGAKSSVKGTVDVSYSGT